MGLFINPFKIKMEPERSSKNASLDRKQKLTKQMQKPRSEKSLRRFISHLLHVRFLKRELSLKANPRRRTYIEPPACLKWKRTDENPNVWCAPCIEPDLPSPKESVASGPLILQFPTHWEKAPGILLWAPENPLPQGSLRYLVQKTKSDIQLPRETDYLHPTDAIKIIRERKRREREMRESENGRNRR
jgi:hypothetical protein